MTDVKGNVLRDLQDKKVKQILFDVEILKLLENK